MSFKYPITQDLKTLVIKGRGNHVKLQQQRQGKTESVKKTTMSDKAIKMANLDNDNENTKVKTVSKEVGDLIRNKRVSKNMTQKQLASLVNMTQSSLQKYENGTAVSDNQILIKLGRKLGVNLINTKKNKK